MSDELIQYAEENTILEIRTGSQLYGTNTPESDEDFVGIFLPPEEYVLGLKNTNEVSLSQVDKDEVGKNTKDAIDRKLYELRKFINLSLGNNPNILEILYVNPENIVKLTNIGEELLLLKDIFPSKLCIPAFIGYAHAQKHKMIIKRDHYNDFLNALVYLERLTDKTTMAEVFNRHIEDIQEPMYCGRQLFAKKGTGIHIHVGDICFEPGIYVKKAKKLIQERIDRVTNRSELVTKYGFDTKFGSHLIRLLLEARDLLSNGQLIFPLKDKDYLLDIKNGKYTAEEVVAQADEIEKELDSLKESTKLPNKPNYKVAEEFVIKTIRKHLL
jgi:hypothetical protein